MEKHGTQIDGRSLIRTTGLPLDVEAAALQEVDWVFFTSRNSVIHFFERQPALSPNTRFAVIGRGSEEQLRQTGHVPHFSGAESGIDMEGVAAEFAKMAEGATVLIPRAVDTLGTMRRGLTAGTKVLDVPIYQTELADEVEASDADVLIFTSPSNVRAYFAANQLAPGQRIISIGYASGKELENLGHRYVLPATPDEIGLAEAVFGLNL
ncbi:MAG TPA: uroporphyrinogen-III synthase [Sphingobacteriaceae bacterium]|nr:uroporphyrinogen-III synthase [Sphingobacteriaceae bacterium]